MATETDTDNQVVPGSKKAEQVDGALESLDEEATAALVHCLRIAVARGRSLRTQEKREAAMTEQATA
jgi:hypothetical protein